MPLRRARDLTDTQLRHLLLASLHPTVAVDAWGADRETLVEMASSNGIDVLSKAQLEEVGPAQRGVDPQTAKFEKQLAARRRHMQAQRSVGLGANTKLYLQLAFCFLLVLFNTGRLEPLTTRLGMKVGSRRRAPPLPACAAPKWWQQPLPRRFKPGAKGECVV